MNDDDLTSLHELASSHLDGDNSQDARAHVAATPQLQALVAAFESVRAQLADVSPAPIAAREAALAAALAAFDEQQVAPAASDADLEPAASAPVISLASRRRWPSRVMGVAAAVAVLGVVGLGVTQLGGSSDSTSSADSAAKSEMAVGGGGDEVQIESAAESVPAMAPPSTIGSINSAGSVATVINTPADLAALPSPAANDADPAAGVPEGSIDQRIASSHGAAVACLSDTQVYLADIFYDGTFGIAARDTVTGVTSAIADDCTVLVSAAP